MMVMLMARVSLMMLIVKLSILNVAKPCQISRHLTTRCHRWIIRNTHRLEKTHEVFCLGKTNNYCLGKTNNYCRLFHHQDRRDVHACMAMMEDCQSNQ